MPPHNQKQKMADLARMMKTLDREVSRCSRCGMCQAVCPVYGLTGHEKNSARGKLALLSGLMQEMFVDADGAAARLNYCLLCGACGAGCPMNIDITALFLNARAIIEGFRGLPWWKRFLFRWVVTRPARFDRLLAWASQFQFLILKQQPPPLDGSCHGLASPRLSGRHVVPLAPVPFHLIKKQQTRSSEFTTGSELPPASVFLPGTRGIRVAFFVGCLLDKVFPETAQNIVHVLKKNGVEVIVPDNQGCCGMPVLAGGDREAFHRQMADHLACFDPDQFDYLVTGCATCTAAIKTLWPEMTGGQDDPMRPKLERIADKTHDISAFLVNILGMGVDIASDGRTHPSAARDADAPSGSMHPAYSGTGKPMLSRGIRTTPEESLSRVMVTWHDPCHLSKTLGIRKEPRMLLKSNPAYDFHEMPDPDVCCGMGGSFNLQYYDASVAMGLKKIDAVRASGASVVATGCPACMIQLSDMLARAKLPVAVRHVIDMVVDKKSY